MGTIIPAEQPTEHLNGGSEASTVEVVSHRYSAAGEYELYSSDGVKFLIGREHLAGSTLLALAQHTKVIELHEPFADEQAVHLLLDFQSAANTDAAGAAAGAGADAGLERLLPCLKLAHRYEFAVAGELVLAIAAQLRAGAGGSPLAVFVAAAELDSPDLAQAALAAMARARAPARTFCPLGWSAGTFAAVPKNYHWAFQACFVRRPATEGGGGAEEFVLEEGRFAPALFEYNALLAAAHRAEPQN